MNRLYRPSRASPHTDGPRSPSDDRGEGMADLPKNDLAAGDLTIALFFFAFIPSSLCLTWSTFVGSIN